MRTEGLLRQSKRWRRALGVKRTNNEVTRRLMRAASNGILLLDYNY
jgi:hypothetical protein